MAVIDVFAQSIMFLAQEAKCNYKVVNVFHALALGHIARSNIHVLDVRDNLYLAQLATTSRTINVSAESSLVFVQAVHPKAIVVEVTSYLTMWHEARHENQFPLIEQNLVLTQVATADVSKGTYDTLVLTQVATCNMTRNLEAANTLTMRSEAVGFLPSKYWTSYDVIVEAP